MSTLALSIRSLTSNQQQAMHLLFELSDIFNTCSECYQELEVSRLKLMWWKEELHVMYQGHPRHPLTQKLLPLCTRYQLPEAKFQALLEGALARFNAQAYDTQIDLEQNGAHTGGLVSSLMAQICLFPKTLTSAQEKCVIQAGVCWEVIRHMAHFPALVTRGYLPLPLADLDAYPIEPSALIEAKNHATLSTLLLTQATRARTLAQTLLATQEAELLPLRRYTRIQLALLTQIEQDHFQVLKHEWHLGFFKKWWISWRTV
jgi:phytoene synthase